MNSLQYGDKMESVFERLEALKIMLTELNQRLDRIEAQLNDEDKPRFNIQKDVEIQTAVKRLNRVLR